MLSKPKFYVKAWDGKNWWTHSMHDTYEEACMQLDKLKKVVDQLKVEAHHLVEVCIPLIIWVKGETDGNA